MHFEASANSLGKRDTKLTAEMLAEIADAGEDFQLTRFVPGHYFFVPKRKAADPQPALDRAVLLRVNPALLARIARVEEHAECDCFAVADAEGGHQLELVRRPMSEVQRASAPVLEWISIRPNMREMLVGAAEDQLLHRGEI